MVKVATSIFFLNFSTFSGVAVTVHNIQGYQTFNRRQVKSTLLFSVIIQLIKAACNMLLGIIMGCRTGRKDNWDDYTVMQLVVLGIMGSRVVQNFVWRGQSWMEMIEGWQQLQENSIDPPTWDDFIVLLYQ